jgi:hypothetical protein
VRGLHYPEKDFIKEQSLKDRHTELLRDEQIKYDAKWVKGRQAGLDSLFTCTVKIKPPGVRNPNGQS